MLAEDDREALAKHLGCSPDLLRHDRSAGVGCVGIRRRLGPYAAPKGYSVVPEIDVRVAAGAGVWNDEPEEIKESWLFTDPLIRHEFRAKPGDLRMITADGDSMALQPEQDRLRNQLQPATYTSPSRCGRWRNSGQVSCGKKDGRAAEAYSGERRGGIALRVTQ